MTDITNGWSHGRWARFISCTGSLLPSSATSCLMVCACTARALHNVLRRRAGGLFEMLCCFPLLDAAIALHCTWHGSHQMALPCLRMYVPLLACSRTRLRDWTMPLSATVAVACLHDGRLGLPLLQVSRTSTPRKRHDQPASA